MCTTVLAKIL